VKHCRKVELFFFPVQGLLGETGKLIWLFLYEECGFFNELMDSREIAMINRKSQWNSNVKGTQILFAGVLLFSFHIHFCWSRFCVYLFIYLFMV
jgi:hypothetical protein